MSEPLYASASRPAADPTRPNSTAAWKGTYSNWEPVITLSFTEFAATEPVTWIIGIYAALRVCDRCVARARGSDRSIRCNSLRAPRIRRIARRAARGFMGFMRGGLYGMPLRLIRRGVPRFV